MTGRCRTAGRRGCRTLWGRVVFRVAQGGIIPYAGKYKGPMQAIPSRGRRDFPEGTNRALTA
ncbi:hypothetical protein GCM10010430_76810 [Kitasatospora cystarginea]|uniref:Uncharacterized protein n=1 Tax=Kitasatospora cystarginea TaxID=58350 RepID=A0ABN3F045_9ACTN